MRRTIALALAGLLVAPAAGCVDGTPPAADTGRELADGVAAIEAGVYRFEVTTGRTSVTGDIHAPTRSAQIESTEDHAGNEVRTIVRFVGDQAFVNVRRSGDKVDDQAKYWTPIEPAESPLPRPAVGDPDAVGMKALLDAANISAGIGGMIIGDVEASDVSAGDHLLGRLVRAELPADAPQSISFTVTMGPLNRIDAVDLTVAGQPWSVRFRDFGRTLAVVVPPASDLRPPAS